MAARHPVATLGSPPRPWGRWRAADGDGAGFRFTPTPVGTIVSRCAASSHGAVHPHARGDDPHSVPSAVPDAGSPPRPWGRYDAHRAVRVEVRFTPTPVGTIPRSPRIYAIIYGSPPRPWGRLPVEREEPRAPRFTPTPVGTISARAGRATGAPVHPHARGDDGLWTLADRDGRGSPPRPWGRCVRARARQLQSRFTPTPVGTISTPARSKRRGAVHPHARGDDIAKENRPHRDSGSPPRPWGRFPPPEDIAFRLRFTPTPVGTMRYSTGACRRTSVHPHARGDDASLAGRAGQPLGSPPRPWGRCLVHRVAALRERFTPTPVGTMGAPQRTHCHPAGSPPRPWGRFPPSIIATVRDRFTPTPVGTMAAARTSIRGRGVHPHARGDDIGARTSMAAPHRFTPTPVGTMAGACSRWGG